KVKRRHMILAGDGSTDVCSPDLKHSQAAVEAVGAQLVNLRAVSAVVHRADQDAKSLTLERLELLDIEQQPAVALEQHDLAVAAQIGRASCRERVERSVRVGADK